MKSWYQVKNVEAEMIHRGKALKPKQLVYLTKEQAALHNQFSENLIEAQAPKTVLDAAYESEFKEWEEENSDTGES